MTPIDSVSSFPTRRAPNPRRALLYAGLALGAFAAAIGAGLWLSPASPPPPTEARPSMTVALGAPRLQLWPVTIEAPGAIAAWQETIISGQLGGLQLLAVRVNVGDVVRAGQVLATFDPTAPRAEHARLSAALAQAAAAHAQALANRGRAESLAGSGAISAQEMLRYATEADSAAAAVQAARAALDAQVEQLRYVEVRAPANGVIVARNASPGAVGGVGAELFRMIPEGRLEWRGEVTAAQLSRLSVGQEVQLKLPDGATARARVRQTAPSLDPQTRLGLVYADLADRSSARAGMYADGQIHLAQSPALTAPAASLVLRDGRHYLFTATPQGRDLVVRARVVTTGRRQGSDVEILQGGAGGGRLVVTGAGFLKDGDIVRETAPAAARAMPIEGPAA